MCGVVDGMGFKGEGVVLLDRWVGESGWVCWDGWEMVFDIDIPKAQFRVLGRVKIMVEEVHSVLCLERRSKTHSR